jgi:hypothetical protein
MESADKFIEAYTAIMRTQMDSLKKKVKRKKNEENE